MAFDYDVLIIGSGFGATVLALDQAAKGKTIMILERGVWWSTPEITAENPMNPYLKTKPVQYWPRPDHEKGLVDFLATVKANGPLGDLQDFANDVADFFGAKKRPQPLYRYNTFKDADVVTASGVGGGSLIYSNVTLEPHFDAGAYPVMASWTPAARLSQADYGAGLNWMKTKRGMPQEVVTKYPQAVPGNDWATLTASDPRLMGRARFLRDATTSAMLDPAIKSQIADAWKPLSLQLAEGDPSKPDSNHNYCERQGRCFVGCLPGARHTLNKSLLKGLLPLLNNNTVNIRPLANVDFVEPLAGGGYTVHYEGLDDGNRYHPKAKTVILAAGTLGTSEILLRSREKSNGSLPLSDKLGSQFSTNGDFAGFITVDRDKLQYPIYATRGPINMSHVTFRDGNLVVNIEDAGIPPMFASLVDRTLRLIGAGNATGVIKMLGLLWNQSALPNSSDPNRFQTEAEMLMNTCWFNVMGTDGATGKFELDHGRLKLSFSDKLSDHPTFQKAETILQQMAKAMNGKYTAFPLWAGLEPFVKRKIVVTHPLGGCPIGGSSTDGVVNATGQVYSTKAGSSSVHDGLFIADGSMVPGPLAANPTLTIVSMALRVAAALP